MNEGAEAKLTRCFITVILPQHSEELTAVWKKGNKSRVKERETEREREGGRERGREIEGGRERRRAKESSVVTEAEGSHSWCSLYLLYSATGIQSLASGKQN